MRKAVAAALLALAGLVLGTTNASATSTKASCNGILVSSLAGDPGVVADETRRFHDAFKEAGIPPGFFDVAGAQAHEGTVDDCLTELGGGG